MNAIKKTFQVSGMSCDHCENAIRAELKEVNNINAVDVSSETGLLTVTFTEGSTVSDATILEAVDEAGYEAKILDS
ncbi:MAG TPA: cation transporter [Microbacteriaceae bacterium]|nr:cation transporter [Microbacteriaceae bacterium]